MRARIDPEPPEPVRKALLAALAAPTDEAEGAWAEAALKEGVEEDESDP